MTKAEIYKLRTHRTPLVCAGLLLAGVLAPSVVMIWYHPSDPTAYTDTYMGIFGLLGAIMAIVFGGWILGTEYRQGTLKRMLTSEPRRIRALTAKATVGAVALTTAMMSIGIIGWAGARAIGNINDVTVAFEFRQLLAATIVGLIAASIAFGVSAITRSDSFAMIGTLGTLFVLDPLIGVIPKVGKYTVGSAMSAVENAISGVTDPFQAPHTLGTTASVITLSLWLVAIIGAGAAVFSTRDA